ncbi:hypothetical protein NIES2109_17680 [Nostoc sp. HK-01]|uniref:DUF2808 domain-containing protein n=1 Tax=Nostoc cycadae WK-1 TaxID=1861711 RepID=A0A2H6LF79_9NOSO|nr:DUF2808 domain-containing protein [Nostoc cycadae]BBD58989.1 hypothetical protein NIES2109_17680 [Nostoc sp. HK-01]GBE91868.1 hypothetical protein NCWK1_1621 [Nostoc cycadae WK-1]
MKRLILLSSVSLAIAATCLPAQAQRQDISYNSTAPRISSTSGYDNTHTISVYTGMQPLSYLIVRPSDAIKVSDNIDVTDQSGRRVDTSITREDDRKIRINFSQPIPPGTNLNIAFRNIDFANAFPNRSFVYYDISGGHIGLSREVPYGLAQVQVY